MDIVLDFDGTVVTHDYPDVGKNIGAQDVLKELIESNHNLILFTMRSGDQLKDAEDWFKKFEIPLYGVQYNPKQKSWTSSNKCYGQLYIDDAALGCPLRTDLRFSNRPFVDWSKVKQELVKRGIIILKN